MGSFVCLRFDTVGVIDCRLVGTPHSFAILVQVGSWASGVWVAVRVSESLLLVLIC